MEIGSLADWVSGVATTVAVIIALWRVIYRPKKEAMFIYSNLTAGDMKFVPGKDYPILAQNVWNRVEHLEPCEVLICDKDVTEKYKKGLQDIVLNPNGQAVPTGITFKLLNDWALDAHLGSEIPSIKVMYRDTANRNRIIHKHEIGFTTHVYGAETDIETVYK